MKKTFEAWETIFQAKKIDCSKNLHFVTADEIKKISRLEPRIMAKMDDLADLPPVFKNHGYFLLPVVNGKYAIVRGNGFHALENGKLIPKDFQSRIKFPLTTAGRGSSEMQYLDYSFNSGAIESILATGPLYQSIRGREFTKAFSFLVNKTSINVSSVQIEVDSGLEGENSIVLLEAKIGKPDDFIIRQLFYPYNHFRIISPKKEIIPVFFTYDLKEETYNFWIYKFTDQKNYNSIELQERKILRIRTKEEFELSDVKPVGVVQYKDLIPQANDLDKVIELVFKVSEGIKNYHDIAIYFEFNERQSSYYREAAEALGLVVSKSGKYELTDAGLQLIRLPIEKRNIFVVEILNEFNLVKLGLEILRQNKPLTKKQIASFIEKNSSLTGTTIGRRADSLISWYKWISRSTGMFKWDGRQFIIE